MGTIIQSIQSIHHFRSFTSDHHTSYVHKKQTIKGPISPSLVRTKTPTPPPPFKDDVLVVTVSKAKASFWESLFWHLCVTCFLLFWVHKGEKDSNGWSLAGIIPLLSLDLHHTLSFFPGAFGIDRNRPFQQSKNSNRRWSSQEKTKNEKRERSTESFIVGFFLLTGWLLLSAKAFGSSHPFHRVVCLSLSISRSPPSPFRR